ncbi:hypothetical protein CRUP_033336 [Coryphaenoides rupestris]|nr:hypothetical protein CRUP_033336 [Coryphaenoides rupestris]
MSGEVYLLWLLSLIQTLSAYSTELSSEACRELGFSSNLLCSSCDLLGEFGLSQIQPVCRQCCQQEAQLEARKARVDLNALPRGHLGSVWMKIGEVPPSPSCGNPTQNTTPTPTTTGTTNLSMLPFVRSDKPKMFRGLQIKYVRGSDPVLKLLDDAGNMAEELSILKWNTDSVEEFLSEKLERV